MITSIRIEAQRQHKSALKYRLISSFMRISRYYMNQAIEGPYGAYRLTSPNLQDMSNSWRATSRNDHMNL